MFRVLTLNTISSAGLRKLPSSLYAVGDQISDPDAILVRSHDMHSMEIASSVKAVGRAGAGTNNIPILRLNSRGIPVFNTPGANANAVKELVLAGLLIAARNLVPALRFVEKLDGEPRNFEPAVESGKKQFAGEELPGHTLGIVGLGKVGSLVADSAIKLGMRVLGYDPEITVDAAWNLPSQVKKAGSIEEVFRAADFVTLHVPLIDSTKNLVNRESIAEMRAGCVLLNFSREGIVENDAVLEALQTHRLKYYVSDFPNPAFKDHSSVIALPHLGASTAEAEENCAMMVVDQVRDYLEHGNISNAVNFPDVVMQRESPYRVAIANANVPNMVGQISTAMASADLNIHNMMNKSKGEIAYTLVDIDSPLPEELCRRISQVSGVLSIRDVSLNSIAVE